MSQRRHCDRRKSRHSHETVILRDAAAWGFGAEECSLKTGRSIVHIKSILAGTAIALVAGVGSVSAGDQFTTLDGVAAVPMTSEHMGAIRGAEAPGIIEVNTGSTPVIHPSDTFPASPPPLVVVNGEVVAGG